MMNRMKTFLHLLCLFCLFAVCGAASAPEEELHVNSLLQCPEEDICSVASKCCVTGVDSYGWIAAAVGWSLWFLTLILFCVGKIMDLRPDEPKYLQA
ncbi:transmembrane protein 213 [Spea bombifrons]|uniref:transmembrane protein 213 n=1 Tax=Spea bombifrons TaxID=233779 RepID=UPI0023490CB3|nr:transmembrane protein 213 [Spea bombifrons]